MSHTHRSPLRTGIARALRYVLRSARAEFGRVTARRVRRATQKAFSRVAAGGGRRGRRVADAARLRGPLVVVVGA